MPLISRYASVFDHVHDVVIFGAGHAGLGALTGVLRSGRRVLLVDRRGDIAWESSRAMCTDPGTSDDKAWKRWMCHLQHHQACPQGCVLPAASEALATRALATTPGVSLLYYVAPVAVQMYDDCLAMVTVATRDGLARIAGKQFIDATEQGELVSLLPGGANLRKPRLLRSNLFFQKTRWADDKTHAIQGLGQVKASLAPSCWNLQRCVQLELPGDQTQPRDHLLPALEAVHQHLGDFMHEAVLTHSSMQPLPVYDASPASDSRAPSSLPANMLCASPAWVAAGAYDTLASRFELGAQTASQLGDVPHAMLDDHWPSEPSAEIRPVQRIKSDVAVAGLGTGGLMAAVAAGRQGRRVVAFDAMPFAGGVGSGAGIHVYYHGVRGGLQDELDQRIRKIMPLFGQAGQVQGYHPDARKVIADQMLREAGVNVMQGVLAHVTHRDGHVQRAIISTAQGPVQIDAPAWIDSTGDGELAARAGATFNMGREADGQFHAFTQSSGRASPQDGVMRMFCLNYDAGHVDPTDSSDMTRARVLGVSHYVQTSYRADDHPTMIAPMLGVRQGRHIHADYMLTLADLINHRQFEDVVAYTRCHYDNHAVDYELESDESLFWVWVCQQWHRPLHCDVPYRCLIPRGLENLWLACRALGVSQDAQYVIRMQRDMQRIGEVAGLAAAMASRDQCRSRQVDYHTLAEHLRESGALRAGIDNAAVGEPSQPALDRPVNGQSPADLWSLYQTGAASAGDEVLKLIASDDADLSWHGAAVAAMWGWPAAQDRLCQAIATREGDHKAGGDAAHARPRSSQDYLHVPRWLAATALLRLCGNEDCLATLETLARDRALVANARTSIALTLQRIAMRIVMSDGTRAKAVGILHQLLASDVPLKAAPPRRPVLDAQIRHEPDHGYWRPVVMEDFHWQMHWAIARALMALGAPVHRAFWNLLDDRRAIVRRAAAGIADSGKTSRHQTDSHDADPAQDVMAMPSLQGVS